MNPQPTNHWKLGLFVLFGCATLVGALFWLGAVRLGRDTFIAVTYFDESVQGLDVGSPVKFRGVPIGTVSWITVAEDRRHIQVNSEIDLAILEELGLVRMGDEPEAVEFIGPELRFQLVSTGLTGGKFLQADVVDPSEHPPPELPFEPPRNYVPSMTSTLESLEQDLVATARLLPELVNQLTRFTENLDQILIQSDVESVSILLQQTLDEAYRELLALDLGALQGRADRLLGEGEAAVADLRRVLGMLEEQREPVAAVLARLDSSLGAFETALAEARVEETAASLRRGAGAVQGLAEEGTALSRDLASLAPDLRRDLQALEEALEAIRALAERLEQDPSVLIRGGPPPERAGEEDRR